MRLCLKSRTEQTSIVTINKNENSFLIKTRYMIYDFDSESGWFDVCDQNIGV